MSGKEILIDTNIIIYLLQGDDTLENVLQGKQLYVSFMTELELMGLSSLTSKEEKQIEALLDECLIVPMSANIKNQYRSIRKNYKLKLADSLIAATSLSLGIPLITADKQFRTIEKLELIQYEK